jgi:ferredoxin
MAWRVKIIAEECTGCGMCAITCPEVFRVDEASDISVIILPEGGPEKAIRAALDHCPVKCIRWEE